mmetsp:Transcript_8137/g.9772  ORF Transcript_8137/g.9772 Transcript_8137/m.9772 type:complete len:125 (+) Transcript_8137:189-563(+)
MKNSTIDQITNTDENIRKIIVRDVKVTHVRRSLEKYDPMYWDSMIIVTKNETAGASRGKQYSVTRYWRNPFTKSIEGEYLFDMLKGPYRDVFVFDDYAIVLKQNTINAVFFDSYRGKTVPLNLE